MAVSSASATAGQSRNLILAAMIFAVAMTFIDQTIVSIAAPEIQKELHLTSTGMQWAINAYLLSLASLFAFGGRLADTVGHRKMVTLGVIVTDSPLIDMSIFRVRRSSCKTSCSASRCSCSSPCSSSPASTPR